MKRKLAYTTILLLALLLVSCGGSAPTESSPADAPPAPEVEVEAPTTAPEPTTELEPTAVPEPDFAPQPPDAQHIEFEASDGTALVGYY